MQITERAPLGAQGRDAVIEHARQPRGRGGAPPHLRVRRDPARGGVLAGELADRLVEIGNGRAQFTLVKGGGYERIALGIRARGVHVAGTRFGAK